jgi:hypothetical protein
MSILNLRARRFRYAAAAVAITGVAVLLLWDWIAGQTTSGRWSLITMMVSFGGLILQHWNQRWSWLWGIGAQVVWTAAGIALARPGDIGLSVVFTCLYLHLLWHHRRRDFRREHLHLAAARAEVDRLTAKVADLQARLEQCPERALVGVR